MGRITVPTLLVAGEQDALVPIACHEEVAAEVADPRLVVLPGTGHLAPLEEPAAVAAALSSWLGRAPTSDP
jgi:pimeloyl-ACP methyl ester carboxylesterase